MSYVITGLDPARFRHLYGRSDAELAEAGAVRIVADGDARLPCRVTLNDVTQGDAVLALNFEHLPVETIYRSRHAIFVRDGAQERARFEGRVPAQLASRLLSVRSFDADDMMIDAEVTEGIGLEAEIARMFGDPRAAWLHVHFARRGCFAARVDRA
ncbi:DUF1203 domain-containing protein [Sphingomonas sp. ST-64]|uniref:DUF1203 domain-containing protein n=1 Tax=Sphingomonas plantiphila TaxID=3163295 RepID=A0ABW8YNL4_9SPHN